jgi:peptidoglycan/xylan/chitin deacetylase (PgdA/CDA1 family)
VGRSPRALIGLVRFAMRTAPFPFLRLFGTVTYVRTTEPVAALTFDDGPDPTFTPRIAAILEEAGARGTFFMVGEAVKRCPEIVRRVALGGHAVGNHSWSHPIFPLLSSRERRMEMRSCEQSLRPYGSGLFRPPFGRQTVGTRLDALLLGYEVVTWNLSAGDWLEQSPEEMVRVLEDGLRPGSIILLHDGLYYPTRESLADRRATVEAVALFLSRTRNHYRFVTLPELFRSGRRNRELWFRSADRAWWQALYGPINEQPRGYGSLSARPVRGSEP